MSKRIPLIISVESRKGGVGKTTAALCMARLLRKKGYAVLLMDLDVTGTNAADIAKSPFWERDLHIIQEAGDKDNSKRPLNLITLFDQCFMAGMTIPEFSIRATSKVLLIEPDKVNVVGSQIYKTDKGGNNSERTTCIERPGILFDDLHALWLLELVKQISNNFARAVSSEGSVKIAIILDNSPGYVGIAPVVHEWLTDRGPEYGKFLMVTSLDTQDLCACEMALSALHDLFVGKWETHLLFVNGYDKDSEFTVKKEQESFFMRLASSRTGRKNGEVDPLDFYRNDDSTNSKQHPGQRYCDNPAEYIAAIVNRVPRATKSGFLDLESDHPWIWSERGGTLSRLLDRSNEKQDWRERMISYDEYIENQFLLRWLQRGRRYRELNVHYLIDMLEMAEDELRGMTHDDDIDPIRLSRMDYEQYERLSNQLRKANDVVSRARTAVENAGLGHLTRLIHDEWLPGSIVPTFRNMLLRVLRESEVPFFEMEPFDYENGHIHPESMEFMADLKKRMLKGIRSFEEPKLEAMDNKAADVLASVLSGLIGLSLALSKWHLPMKEELTGLFAGVLAIELRHWAKRGEGKSQRFGPQRFLAQESVSQAELRKDHEMVRSFRFFRHNMTKEYGTFPDFYKACTSAQARLMDFMSDSRFLIQLLRFVATGEMKRGELFPFVRGIAEDVIVKKTISHEDAPSKMEKALQSAEYFREFDSVLSDVLKVWRVANE